MKCFGDTTKTFHIKLILLDEQELVREVQEATNGQKLLDLVFHHLNLQETSYFGLRYIDSDNQTHWLDPNKRLCKQLKGATSYVLYFSVKFYAADPTKLVEEVTRYQFFLQIKQDVLQGRLPITSQLAAELGSFAVQSELGDYDPNRHLPDYVSEFRCIASQSVELENKISELHKKLAGFVPSKAELHYLEKVKWLDMYGVDLHPVLGEDSTEYFLGLTPTGIIVLRNKAKVGNYFWPRISRINFKNRAFLLRVKDKNNSENTYGFETPSKSACKHLWQCCIEHHAFFRLTQSSGNNPQALLSLGSVYRYSGRTEKEALNDAKKNARPQEEFVRTPSRRHRKRVLEGVNGNRSTSVETVESKPETRTVVSLPGNVTPASNVYRSTSLTMNGRSSSPRSTHSVPHSTRVPRYSSSTPNGVRREGRPTSRGESPRSTKSSSAIQERIARRTSSVESQSSVDSRSCHRSCSRHRRHRSSDGESEASSKCSSSKGHRRHRHRKHRHHSGDSSDHHKHRHRRRRQKSSEREKAQLIESGDQWARVQSGQTPSKSNTATVRDLTSGYLPGCDDNETEMLLHRHSRRKHRKHRSPSEHKMKNYPEEIRRHIEFNIKNTNGWTEEQLKEIPYTEIEPSKHVDVRNESPKSRSRRSPRRSRRSPSSQKNSSSLQTYNEENRNQSRISGYSENGFSERSNRIIDKEVLIVNGPSRPHSRSNHGVLETNTNKDSLYKERSFSLQNSKQHEIDGRRDVHYTKTSSGYNHKNYIPQENQSPSSVNHPTSYDLNSNNIANGVPHHNKYSEGGFVPHSNSRNRGEEEGLTNGFVEGNLISRSPVSLKNNSADRNFHFNADLKPQPSPQSSVTSGISVGSSSPNSEGNRFTRRGSAGSLDFILGPLIQSALEHQQR